MGRHAVISFLLPAPAPAPFFHVRWVPRFTTYHLIYYCHTTVFTERVTVLADLVRAFSFHLPGITILYTTHYLHATAFRLQISSGHHHTWTVSLRHTIPSFCTYVATRSTATPGFLDRFTSFTHDSRFLQFVLTWSLPALGFHHLLGPLLPASGFLTAVSVTYTSPHTLGPPLPSYLTSARSTVRLVPHCLPAVWWITCRFFTSTLLHSPILSCTNYLPLTCSLLHTTFCLSALCWNCLRYWSHCTPFTATFWRYLLYILWKKIFSVPALSLLPASIPPLLDSLHLPNTTANASPGYTCSWVLTHHLLLRYGLRLYCHLRLLRCLPPPLSATGRRSPLLSLPVLDTAPACQFLDRCVSAYGLLPPGAFSDFCLDELYCRLPATYHLPHCLCTTYD